MNSLTRVHSTDDRFCDRLTANPARVFTALILFMAIFSACTSTSTTTKPSLPLPTVDPNQARVDALIDWLDHTSSTAQRIHATGDMTVSNEETSQSGSFTLKLNRLANSQSDASVTTRIDSISLEVRGPFGITAVKFLASPSMYFLYNALLGDTYEGRTNADALAGLTQLQGITLESMDDVIFGLAPDADGIDPQDSVVLFSRSDSQHILLIYRFKDNFTEAITLNGIFDVARAPAPAQLAIARYERFPGRLTTYGANMPKPQAVIRFGDHTISNGIQYPRTIDVSTGSNRLVLEYEEVAINPASLTVKINVPRRK